MCILLVHGFKRSAMKPFKSKEYMTLHLGVLVIFFLLDITTAMTADEKRSAK